MLITSNNPTDYSTAEALLGKLQAETTAAKSITARNWAISGGVVGGVVGLTAAALVWAWGQRGPSPEELAQALEKMPTLKVEPVRLDPSANKVALADGSEVKLRDGGEVTLKEGGVVSLEDGASVTVNVPAIKLPEVRTPATTAEGEAIKTTVTVFQTVTYGQAEINTGWEFPTGAARQAPVRQFCYHAIVNADGSDHRVSLGENGKPTEVGRRLMTNFKDAFARCVWWKQGAV